MRILYAGDSGLSIGFDLQGYSVMASASHLVDAGIPFQKAIETSGAEVIRLLSPQIPESFPESFEDLNKFDVVILSDVSCDSLLLYTPDRRRNVPMGPNRLKELRKYIEMGGRLIYCGGYLTFQGFHGLGAWYDSPLAPALPVYVLPLPDDRVEIPEGTSPRILLSEHPSVRDLPWHTRGPLFLGYNRSKAKPEAIVVAEIGDGNDPFIVCWNYGKGKVFVLTTDPVPHWGNGFVNWPGYSLFWHKVLDWLVLP